MNHYGLPGMFVSLSTRHDKKPRIQQRSLGDTNKYIKTYNWHGVSGHSKELGDYCLVGKP